MMGLDEDALRDELLGEVVEGAGRADGGGGLLGRNQELALQAGGRSRQEGWLTTSLAGKQA